MNKLIWIIGGILLVVAVAGAVLISQTQDAQERGSMASHKEATGNATVGATGSSSIITYTDAGFSPATLTIAPGTTVTWNNQSGHALWIMEQGDSSACPLSGDTQALNECASVSQGGTFSHTFTSAGTISYINKERPEDGGTITVLGSGSSTPPGGPLNPNVILQ